MYRELGHACLELRKFLDSLCGRRGTVVGIDISLGTGDVDDGLFSPRALRIAPVQEFVPKLHESGIRAVAGWHAFIRGSVGVRLRGGN